MPMMKPDEAIAEIRRIAESETSRLYFSDHAEMRMIEREVNRSQVCRILANGRPQGEPDWEADHRTGESGWKCRIHDISAGARITVVAKLILVGADLDEPPVLVITVFEG